MECLLFLASELGNRRLPNCWGGRERVSVFVEELNHELDVSLGKALRFRQFGPQLAGQPGNDAGAPARSSLPPTNQPADVPVKANQFGVRGEYRPCLRLQDASLDLLHEFRKASRNCQTSTLHGSSE
jgi:hypothetical protein